MCFCWKLIAYFSYLCIIIGFVTGDTSDFWRKRNQWNIRYICCSLYYLLGLCANFYVKIVPDVHLFYKSNTVLLKLAQNLRCLELRTSGWHLTKHRRRKNLSARNLIILGFESLDEYIDNKHPLWCDLKVIFRDYLHASEEVHHDFLADWVHDRWRSGHKIDLNRNLSCFPRQRSNTTGKTFLSYLCSLKLWYGCFTISSII